MTHGVKNLQNWSAVLEKIRDSLSTGALLMDEDSIRTGATTVKNTITSIQRQVTTLL